MKRTKKILVLSIALAAVLAGCAENINGLPGDTPSHTNVQNVTSPTDTSVVSPLTTDSNSTSSIKVEKMDSTKIQVIGQGILMDFDMKEQVRETDVLFKGRIEEYQEYKITGTFNDEPMEMEESVMTVEVSKVYYGKLPVKGTKVRVHCGWQNSALMTDTFAMRKGTEYIFFAGLYDAEMMQKIKDNPADISEAYKRADVYIGNNFYCLFPIENGYVIGVKDFDYQEKAIDATQEDAARKYAPKTFEIFADTQNMAVPYSIYPEQYFEKTLQHFWEGAE